MSVERFQRWVIGRQPKRTLIRALILATGVTLLCTWVWRPMRVAGESMLPTYTSGEWNVINKASYWFSDPARGDIVAIRLAGERVSYLKRIIALPGETVSIQDGVTRVNGVTLPEAYLVHRSEWVYDEVTLEDDQYLVIGDNRGMPIEQHMMGKARRHRIIGELLW